LITQEERITANFRDEESLITEVTGGNRELMHLSMEYRIPDAAQCISVPLRRTEVPDGLYHNGRDQDRRLKHRRLMLVIDGERPPIIC
jgi:hypothetical protein